MSPDLRRNFQIVCGMFCATFISLGSVSEAQEQTSALNQEKSVAKELRVYVERPDKTFDGTTWTVDVLIPDPAPKMLAPEVFVILDGPCHSVTGSSFIPKDSKGEIFGATMVGTEDGRYLRARLMVTCSEAVTTKIYFWVARQGKSEKLKRLYDYPATISDLREIRVRWKSALAQIGYSGEEVGKLVTVVNSSGLSGRIPSSIEFGKATFGDAWDVQSWLEDDFDFDGKIDLVLGGSGHGHWLEPGHVIFINGRSPLRNEILLRTESGAMDLSTIRSSDNSRKLLEVDVAQRGGTCSAMFYELNADGFREVLNVYIDSLDGGVRDGRGEFRSAVATLVSKEKLLVKFLVTVVKSADEEEKRSHEQVYVWDSRSKVFLPEGGELKDIISNWPISSERLQSGWW